VGCAALTYTSYGLECWLAVTWQNW